MEYRKASNRSFDNATTLINSPLSSPMAMSTNFSSSVSSQTSQGSSSAATTPLGTPSGAPRTKSWHVPGPSTRYHKSEHARPKPTPRSSTNGQHVRNQSSLST
ncbi:hypothetical protein KCU89_g14429, partial [Aureobasidium melanogenum]